MPSIRRVFVRDTHPLLHFCYTVFGVMSVGWGFNFLLFTLPFNAYNLNMTAIGVLFLILGVAILTFLLVFRNYNRLRIALAANIALMSFWGFGTLLTYFQGLGTSWQLPIAFLGLVAIQARMLIESPVTLTNVRLPE